MKVKLFLQPAKIFVWLRNALHYPDLAMGQDELSTYLPFPVGRQAPRARRENQAEN